MSKEAGGDRPRLGRGLSRLIVNSSNLPSQQIHYASDEQAGPISSKQPVQVDKLSMHDIPIDLISSNPYQPRCDFPAEELAELSASIRQQGILQPLIVTSSDDGEAGRFILIAGERRLRAARQAGREHVPCIVRQASRQQLLEWALIENIQREDLNPVDRALAYQNYIDRFNLSHSQAAERLGQPRATVSNYLRLLELHNDVLGLLRSGALSFGHAKVLAGLAGKQERQNELARWAVAEGFSVRRLEELIASQSHPSDVSASPPKTLPARPAYIRDMEDRLTQAVGTRVTIHPGRAKHTGRIVLNYYSLDDFDRLSALLGLKEQD